MRFDFFSFTEMRLSLLRLFEVISQQVIMAMLDLHTCSCKCKIRRYLMTSLSKKKRDMKKEFLSREGVKILLRYNLIFFRVEDFFNLP